MNSFEIETKVEKEGEYYSAAVLFHRIEAGKHPAAVETEPRAHVAVSNPFITAFHVGVGQSRTETKAIAYALEDLAKRLQGL